MQPVMGMDAANEVYQWLSKLKMERYYKTFIENGYGIFYTNCLNLCGYFLCDRSIECNW